MMADGEMGVEVTWALSRHGFLIAIAGVILHDMGCGRRGEKRDDGDGEGERMEGRWWVHGGKMADDGGSYRMQLIRGFALTVFMR